VPAALFAPAVHFDYPLAWVLNCDGTCLNTLIQGTPATRIEGAIQERNRVDGSTQFSIQQQQEALRRLAEVFVVEESLFVPVVQEVEASLVASIEASRAGWLDQGTEGSEQARFERPQQVERPQAQAGGVPRLLRLRPE
jgi:hypothetical protein